MLIDPTPEQIMAARPDELVLLLFQGAANFGRQAVAHMDADRDDEASASVERIRAILVELDSTIDRSAGTMGRHLAAIYEYLMRRISAPVVERNDILEVVSDIETLADAWQTIVEQRDAELATA